MEANHQTHLKQSSYFSLTIAYMKYDFINIFCFTCRNHRSTKRYNGPRQGTKQHNHAEGQMGPTQPTRGGIQNRVQEVGTGLHRQVEAKGVERSECSVHGDRFRRTHILTHCVGVWNHQTSKTQLPNDGSNESADDGFPCDTSSFHA